MHPDGPASASSAISKCRIEPWLKLTLPTPPTPFLSSDGFSLSRIVIAVAPGHDEDDEPQT